MRRMLSALALLGLVATALVAPQVPGASALNPYTITADAAPTWQTNARVWALAYANGVVYAGGEFTAVRPPGANPGQQEQPQNRLAALDSETGELLPFGFDFNATIRALTISPDQSTLYVGGDFTTVNGESRPRIAAIDLATGTLTSYRATPYSGVRAIAVSDDTVYFGGNFITVGGQTRTRLAATNLSGQLLPFAPDLDSTVRSLLLTPDGTRLIVGGSFDHVNGVHYRALGSVYSDTGLNAPWVDYGFPGCVGCDYGATVTTIVTDGTKIYAGLETLKKGLYEGTLAVMPDDGELIWKNECYGANQSIAVLDEVLYVASHAHSCKTVEGGFPPERPQINQHLMAESTVTGQIYPWWPDTNGGPPPTGGLGPRALVAAGDDLWAAGEFSAVNDKPQQGLTRFLAGPDTVQPKHPQKPPTASVLDSGDVKLLIRTTWDRDDGDLVYRVYRDNEQTPVYETTVFSTFFKMPRFKFVDENVTPGVHTYRYEATDGINTSPKSPPVTVTVPPPG